MFGVQELFRIRVVQFFKRIMRTDPGWKLTTVQHFVAERVTASFNFAYFHKFLAFQVSTRVSFSLILCNIRLALSHIVKSDAIDDYIRQMFR